MRTTTSKSINLKHLKASLLMTLLHLLAASHAGASSYYFHHLNSQRGLPHQQVETIVQDRKGYMWFGTRCCLTRYDGYEMVNYFHDENDTTSIGSSYVRKLFVDSKGRLWAATDIGVSRYRPETDDFRNYSSAVGHVHAIAETKSGKIVCGGDCLSVYDEADDSFHPYPIPDAGSVLSLAVDSKDRLFMSTNNRLYCFDPSMKKVTSLPPALYADFLTGVDGIAPLMFDHEGYLWVGRNRKGVMRVDMKTYEKTVYDAGQLSNGIVRCIAESPAHDIVLGTEGGLTVIPQEGEIRKVRHDLTRPNLISDHAIYDVYFDSRQNMWVGSFFGGVDVLLHNNSKFEWIEPGFDGRLLNCKVVRMMTETEPGIIWIASEDNGIVIYDHNTNTSRRFTELPEAGTNVHSLCYDRSRNEMWIGTFFNGVIRYNPKTGAKRRYMRADGLPSEGVFYLARQRNGRLWAATMQGLCYYDPKTDRFCRVANRLLGRTFAFTLMVDHEDNLWVGTTTEGLFRINAKTGRITHWKRSGKPGGLKDSFVTALFEDSEGCVWIGTNTHLVQAIEKGSLHVKSSNQSRFKNEKCCICAFSEDDSKRIWISTSNGMYVYSKANDALKHITSADGLPTNQFNFSSALKLSDGHFAFGTVMGLVMFYPPKIQQETSYPPVAWKSLYIKNMRQKPGREDSPLTDEFDDMKTLRLSYEQARAFSIDFGVVMPEETASVRYQMFIKGLDKEWHNIGQQHTFYGQKLPPGTYELQVRADLSEREWDKCPVRTLRIVVSPPWYRAWWAWVLYILAAALLARRLRRNYLRRQHERERYRTEKMEGEKERAIAQAKFDFFTNVSHELKTPLSLIVAPLKSIRNSGLPSEAEHNLSIALRNTQRLESLINELVMFNKMETGIFRLYVQKDNPMDCIRRTVGLYALEAKNKGLTLTVDCDDQGKELWYSPQYLETILGNLIGNALKFTKEGGISISAFVMEPDNDSHAFLAIDVSDTGIGILPEETVNIFKPYYQTGRGVSTNNKGWGLGLAMVKRMVESHKGSISVDSKPGEGSTFHVVLDVSEDAFDQKDHLPVKDGTSPALAEAADEAVDNHDDGQPDSGSSDKGKPVMLIVEDNGEMRHFLCDSFQHKYKVLTAKNGREALETVREQTVEIIISDVMMDEMDGYELCQTLKEDIETSHIPVILLTAKSEPDSIATGFRSGADAYVTKPFDVKVLEMQADNIMQLIKNRQTVNSDDDKVEEEEEYASLTILDRDFVQRLKKLVDDNIGNSDFTVTDITQELGVSRSLLHIKMKNLFNISMGSYIRKVRLERACWMLDNGYNVAETAYGTGFSDPNYFSKTFKKHYGVNPSEYANRKS